MKECFFPPILRRCLCLGDFSDGDENIPAIIQECQQLFRSEAMFLTLSNLTGLSLHPLADTSSASSSSSYNSDSDPGMDECGESHKELKSASKSKGCLKDTAREDFSDDSSSEQRLGTKRRKLDDSSCDKGASVGGEMNCKIDLNVLLRTLLSLGLF